MKKTVDNSGDVKKRMESNLLTAERRSPVRFSGTAGRQKSPEVKCYL